MLKLYRRQAGACACAWPEAGIRPVLAPPPKHTLVQQCAKLQSTLERDLETGDYLKVTRLSHSSAEKTHVKSKQRHLSKLELLMKRKQKQPELRPEGHDRWVVNLTERYLTPSQNEVLRMGLNFVPVPTKFPLQDTIASVEEVTEG